MNFPKLWIATHSPLIFVIHLNFNYFSFVFWIFKFEFHTTNYLANPYRTNLINGTGKACARQSSAKS